MEKNDMLINELKLEKRETQNTDQETQHSEQETITSSGYISRSDFITWTLIASIGIIFCFLHAYQEYLYKWTASTTEGAQSNRAKVVVSVMSTIIGGCGAAVMMKALVGITYTVMKYRGVGFCQLVTVIGGHLPSHIPLLTAGDGWATIVLILAVVCVSVASKQLAVVSMSVCYISSRSTFQSFTPNFTTCHGVTSSKTMEGVRIGMSLNIYNSLINRNTSHTNEFYDRGIPATLRGTSRFDRILPFTDVSCGSPFNSSNPAYSNVVPFITNNNSTWKTIVTISLNDEISTSKLVNNTNIPVHSWMNCSITSGYASALSLCNNTYCYTERTSDITPYTSSGYGLPAVLVSTLGLLASTSEDYRNPVMTWLMGGELTDTYFQNALIPAKSIDLIKDRIQTLTTVATRVLCDYNNDEAPQNTTPITSHYKNAGYFQYRVMWKWPFYFYAGFIFVSWTISMWTLWVTPESRIMSVEWLLSQYLSRDYLSYMSGRELARAHVGSVFQVLDTSPDSCVGSIVISKTLRYNKIKEEKVVQKRQYQ
ncbi:hypothetical protein INT47_008314 [Mucor saturninus]|uniref:Transmembrane protein n=1 Tax=Mucor saturninus TaxID=64648 RepID=A0A8H7RE33_9FUNG|nr:hypothetical protein INT47_008314 [Mucor saturninus]